MGQRILVLDSDSKFASEVRSNFEQLGAHVDVLADGEEGLARATEVRPDLILLSVELPNVNGFLICKKIKKDPGLRDVPLVILSNDPNADEIFAQHEKLRTRAEGYLRKPIRFPQLLEKVKTLLPMGEHDGGSLGSFADEPSPSAPTGRPAAPSVDAEVNSFADNAFDSLMMDDDGMTQVASRPTDFDIEKMLASRKSSSRPRRSSMPVMAQAAPPPLPPLPEVPVSEPPTAAATESEDVVLDPELDDLRRQLAEAQTKAADAERLERELRELKGRVSKAPGNISSREFLDLREALNSKDKEILALRDQLSARDKQLLEGRDRSLQFERTVADLEDSVAELERQLAETKDRTTALTQDKDAAIKRADDLKGRLERAETKAQKLEHELESERQQQSAELQRIRSEKEEAVARLMSEHEEQSARASSRHAVEMETLKEEHAAFRKTTEEERRKEREELKAAHDAELTQMAEEHATVVHRLTEEHVVERRASTERHSEELARHRATYEDDLAKAAALADEAKTAALARLRDELVGDKERALKEAEELRQTELAEARTQRETSLAELQEELEGHFNKELRNLREKHSQELAVLGRKLAETESALRNAEERARDTAGELADTRTSLSERTEERDGLHADVARLTALVAELEQLKTEQQVRIDALARTQRDLEGSLESAQRKIDEDGQFLERARKAFAIGLSLLEDQKNNALD